MEKEYYTRAALSKQASLLDAYNIAKDYKPLVTGAMDMIKGGGVQHIANKVAPVTGSIYKRMSPLNQARTTGIKDMVGAGTRKISNAVAGVSNKIPGTVKNAVNSFTSFPG